MSSINPLRMSERENKGVPPERLGLTGMRNEAVVVGDEEKTGRDRDQDSLKGSKSHHQTHDIRTVLSGLSVAAQKKGCALQFEKQIAENEELIRNLKLQIMEFEDEEDDFIIDLEEQLADKVVEIENEEIQKTPAEVATLKKDATSLRRAITNRKKKRDREIAAIENQIATLQKKIHLAVVELDFLMQKIDDDENKSVHLSDDNDIIIDDPIEKLKSTEEWARSTSNVLEDSVPVIENEGKMNVVPILSTNSCDSMVQALMKQTEVLTELVKSGGNAASNGKFLARQSAGRELAEFNGRPEQWPQFISDFKRTTESCGFTDSENMTRLRKCLKGKALDAVRSLMVCPDNLPKIMSRLQEIFGDPDIIIKAMIQKARSVEKVKDGRAEELVEFGLQVANLTSTIEVLRMESHLNNPYLVQELEEKLPFSFRLKWLEVVASSVEKKRDLKSFSEWMEIQMSLARKLCTVSIGEKDQNDRPDHHVRWPPRKERTYVSDDQNKQYKAKDRSCHACGKEGHWVSQCRTLKSMKTDERRKLVREKKLCFSCLSPGHRSEDCRRSKSCEVDGCQEKHHPMLHLQRHERIKEDNNNIEIVYNNAAQNLGTILGVLPVTVIGPEGEVDCLAFLDNGSTVSLLEEEIARKIGAEGPIEPFCISTMTSTKDHSYSRSVSFQIKGVLRNSKEFTMRNVRTIDHLNLKNATQDPHTLIKQWPQLSAAKLPAFRNQKPQLLIGNSHCFLSTPLQHVGKSPIEPMAFRSRLGWSVGGPQTAGKSRTSENSYHICDDKLTEDLHEMVKRSFSTEDFGVKVNYEKSRSREDQRAMEIMRRTTIRTESGRFETGLLWKKEDSVLPQSKSMALHRLRCQEKKMDQDPVFAEAYCGKISEYLEKGFIRKMTKEEIQKEDCRTWYLPHFGVINPNKPGKLRLVFDAAAKSQGVSLNDALSQGPDLNQTLVSVLWKFRQYEFAIQGDIKDMFHRVFIRPEDRSSQRFFWRGMERSQHPDVYEMLVMVFGATCSPCSAQFAKNLNAQEYAKEFPMAAEAIQTKFYVDDYLHSVPDKETAMQLIRDVINVQSKAGFEVCNWTSNSKEVIRSIPEELRSKELKEFDMESAEIPTGRVLGLWWDPSTDFFTFKLNFSKVPDDVVEGKRRPTKREVLKVVMSVYDPLGFLGHLIHKAKILLQDVWRSGIGWDDSLSEELTKRWNSWLEELRLIPQVRIRRCYSLMIPTADHISLQVFCDASEKAFAAVAFLRVKNGDKVEVSLVSSKSRVAPLKPLSIPRLELQAALMAVRLAKSIQEVLEVKLDEVKFWSDSLTVLRWIRSDARNFKTFVSHRLGEISETTEVNQWGWIPTKLNVADDATRTNDPSDLTITSRWFTGPSFLLEDVSQWPKEPSEQLQINDGILEVKAEVNIIDEIEDIFGAYKFSSLMRLLKVVAFAQKFICKLKLKKEGIAVPSEVSLDEIDIAESTLARQSQEQSFGEELRCLNGGKKIPVNSRLFNLEPFLEDGIMKVKGRLGKGRILDYDVKHPIILDPKHHFTKLLLQWYHERCGHQGQKTVANEVRQRYWILNGMSAVKKAFRACQACKVRKLKPSSVRMADLPNVRMESNIRPFTNTGLDYFGPLTVKVGRRIEKRWGVVFTCLSTRAVHLELAASLSTDSAIMAIMRMSSRRGTPSHIYSDNGTNFHGASNELKLALKELAESEKVVQERLIVRGIHWHFNPPAAPHMGGAWERLVGSVKRTMEGILKESHPQEETLYTVFTEVEAILNSRPLTDVSVDPDDPECLTPNHFLLGWSSGYQRHEGVPKLGQFNDDDLVLRRKWRIAQRMADHFWIRWRKEYLPTLTRRTKWIQCGVEIKVGDVVVIIEENGIRSSWPLGRVVKTYPGTDSRVRVVDVKTSTGIYKRPLSKICRLDVQRCEDEVPSSGGRMLGC